MVARLAIEKREFRPEALWRVLRVEHRVHPPDQGDRLSDRPDLDVGDPALALDITRVDDEMGRLDRGECVELEREARGWPAP